VLTETFNVNLVSLVTKEFLAARMVEQNASIDGRFAQLDSRLRFLSWTQAIVIAAVIAPWFERLAEL